MELSLTLQSMEYIWILECNPGSFGAMCKDVCSQHCQDSRSCDHITGTCVGGCQDGWIGSKCTESKPISICRMHAYLLIFCYDLLSNYSYLQECETSKYGKDCKNSCGHCVNNDNCNHVNGSCANGCAAGWENDICNKGKLMFV